MSKKEKIAIILPGNLDNVFFENEFPYLEKAFDQIYIFAYDDKKVNLDDIFKNPKIHINFVRVLTFKSAIYTIFNFIRIKELRNELKNCYSFNMVQKLLYAFMYESFYCNFKRLMKGSNIKLDNVDLYLYSFWLSRGAYAISRFKQEYRNRNIKAISRVHGYDLYENRNPINYLPFRELINKNLDKICFISETGKEYFKRKYRFESKDKYFVCKLGTYNKKHFRKKYLEKDKICIASCSSIISVKRLDLIIDVLCKLNIPFIWIHIGGGVLKKEIESYAKKKLSKGSFKFLGKIENRKILDIYMKYDVDYFINMSDSEGIPVSVMEAISIGIPPIARNVGGIAEIIKNNGFLIPEKKQNNYRDEINCFFEKRLQDFTEYQKISNRCVKLWDEQYNAEKNYLKFIDLCLEE